MTKREDNWVMLANLIEFTLEIDKLKNIERRTYISDMSRRENSGEHSWHVAMMAMTLFETYERKEETDLFTSLKMLLLHDLVEIDAGDTYAFDANGYSDKSEREQRAAERLFGILPDPICKKYRALWDEFEEGTSKESVYAHMIDHIQPLILNLATEGKSWREHSIKSHQVLERNKWIKDISPSIHAQVVKWIETAIENEWLLKDN
jgi:putative hydrolases of HD superfamily